MYVAAVWLPKRNLNRAVEEREIEKRIADLEKQVADHKRLYLEMMERCRKWELGLVASKSEHLSLEHSERCLRGSEATDLPEPPHRLVDTWRTARSRAADLVTVRFEARGHRGRRSARAHRRRATRRTHELGWIGCLDGLQLYASSP